MGRVLHRHPFSRVLIVSRVKRSAFDAPGQYAARRSRPYRIHIRPEVENFRIDMEQQMSQQLEKPKGAMSVNDFALWAGIGRTTAWKEIRDGHLRAVKVSARTIIRFADAESWLATRPSLAVQSAQLSHISK